MTPGRCDLAPEVLRRSLRRLSTYDLVEALELDMTVHDAGDVPVRGQMPADGFAPIRDAVATCTARHDLTLLIGGNNAVTRPAAHGLGVPLNSVVRSATRCSSDSLSTSSSVLARLIWL